MNKKLGLALSGGGFRASLYHLGLVRFLRDAGILSQITHITSVSGGSIFAAHLALNWERYNGAVNEFEAAAADFLSFVRLNVRSRILRRFPLTVPLRWGRRFLGKSNRKLTRTGLLEYHYEKYLYGDISLFELPRTPQLHLLTTNLSEGCLCSFNREGLLMVRRQQGHAFRMDRIHTGLATVPMAVTASSAFPGFFPPLDLTGADVGVIGGEFGRQSFTDGGVYDNLGVRMFRFLERQLLAEDHLVRGDFLDVDAAIAALRAAGGSSEESPLRRVAHVLEDAGKSGGDTPLHRLALALGESGSAPEASSSGGASQGDPLDLILSRLWDVMSHYQFQHEPLFADLKLADPAAAELLQASRVGAQTLEMGDQTWLNRHLLEASFQQATGQPCFRRLNSGLDGVIVSDVGKGIKILKSHGGGLIRTALRASDILMDRVWQLENETFKGAGGFVFARITDVVEPHEDATAPHPEIQHQSANIRTDLDQFSALEVSSLVRHGYCVARKVCRSRPDLFGAELPENPPWEPIAERQSTGAAAGGSEGSLRAQRGPTGTTTDARELQASSSRRIWASLFDRRDWITYIYVPILVPIMMFLPYLSIHYYKRSVRLNNLTLSFSQGSPDLTQLGRMLDKGVMKPWKGVEVEEGRDAAEPDFRGFKILHDSRITDLRAWNPAAAGKINADSRIYTYRRLLVVKQPDNEEHPLFTTRLILSGSEGQVRFPPQQVPGRVRKTALKDGGSYRWEAIFDFARVPAGKPVELLIEVQSPGMFLRGSESNSGMLFGIDTETAELSQWVLMPKGRDFKRYRYVFYKKGEPGTAKEGVFTTEYLSDDSTVLAFKILSLEPGYDHEIFWDYK